MNGPSTYPVRLAANPDIAIGAGETVYTDVMNLSGLDTFALSYKATCTGVPNVKIELEQGTTKPNPQNAADDGYVVPETLTEINAALVDTLQHHQAIFPIGLPYMRLKITEMSGVNTDTVLTISLSVQNRF